MGAMPIDLPPFERFYAEHRDVVIADEHFGGREHDTGRSGDRRRQRDDKDLRSHPEPAQPTDQ